MICKCWTLKSCSCRLCAHFSAYTIPQEGQNLDLQVKGTTSFSKQSGQIYSAYPNLGFPHLMKEQTFFQIFFLLCSSKLNLICSQYSKKNLEKIVFKEVDLEFISILYKRKARWAIALFFNPV